MSGDQRELGQERWVEEPMDWVGGYASYDDEPPAPAPRPVPVPGVEWLAGVDLSVELAVVGSFRALHHGHLALLSRVSSVGRVVRVFVLTDDDDPVAAATRADWIRALAHPFTEVTVTRLSALPERCAGLSLALVSASAEDEAVSRAMGARFVQVPRNTDLAPATTEQLRAEPARHWEQLLAASRAHYALRVCLIGPEGTGKSTLAARLARHCRSRHVPESLRSVMVNAGLALTLNHVESAAKQAHLALVSALASGGRVVFLDTDILSLSLWSERILGKAPPSLGWRREAMRVDLYLLTDLVDQPDLPQLPGPGRDVFFQRCRGALAGLPHVLLSGSLDERFEQALAAVDPLMRRPLW